jgi:hypothetical protein
MARVNYNVIAQKYRNVGKGNVRLTQSSLFLTKPISPTVTTYTFDVLETQTATLQNDEIRLNLNDEFIITQIGMYLVGSIGGIGRMLFTTPPYEVDVANANDLTAFYNGAFKIAINNIVYMEKWDTAKHEKTGITQFQNFDSMRPYGPATLPEKTLAKDGMYGVEPMITLSGAKKNDLVLQLPSAITAGNFSFTDYTGITSTIAINRVGLLLRGFNAQNGATFQG